MSHDRNNFNLSHKSADDIFAPFLNMGGPEETGGYNKLQHPNDSPGSSNKQDKGMNNESIKSTDYSAFQAINIPQNQAKSSFNEKPDLNKISQQQQSYNNATSAKANQQLATEENKQSTSPRNIYVKDTTIDDSDVEKWYKLSETAKTAKEVEKKKKEMAEKAEQEDNLLNNIFLGAFYYPEDASSTDNALAHIADPKKKFFKDTGVRKVFLMLKLASFYAAVDKKDKLDELLTKVENLLIFMNQCKETADSERVFYLIKANALLEDGGPLEVVLKLLEKCWNVPQEYFLDSKEDFLDFYAETLGKVYFKKGDFTKAEDYFLDALALREKLGDKRLISLSYSDLAELYIHLAAKEPGYVKKAQEYINLAETNACHGLDGFGMVNYKMPDLEKLRGKIKKLKK